MRTEHGETKMRSAAEVAFMVMRVLATARLLWARGGAVPIAALSALVPADGAALAFAVDRLCDEGIAEHAPDATVRLTERAAFELVPDRAGRHDPAAAA
jgi:hypothetical protein